MNCACETKGLKEKVGKVVLENPSQATLAMARELEINEMDVIRNLPEYMVKEVSKDRFDEIIAEVSTWGMLTVIVQNESTILEVKAPFPMGTYGHGYYNLKSKDTPVGGHIKADDLSAIFFLSKPFMGLESHSIQFFNKNGNAMFKLYLGRDENRQIIQEQKDKFINLKDKQDIFMLLCKPEACVDSRLPACAVGTADRRQTGRESFRKERFWTSQNDRKRAFRRRPKY
jgi:putative heme utilization carrier protein HutX